MREVVFKLRLWDTCQSLPPRLNGIVHLVNFNVAQHRSFNSAVGKIKARPVVFQFLRTALLPAVAVLDLRRWKLHRARVAMRSEPVDDRASRISQTQQLRHLIESLSGGIVARVANVFVRPTLIPS